MRERERRPAPRDVFRQDVEESVTPPPSRGERSRERTISGATTALLEEAMKGHILEKPELPGFYRRKRRFTGPS
jgi:phosphatidylethanolamine-binding protein (PEBP) family uncharacterized protein